MKQLWAWWHREIWDGELSGNYPVGHRRHNQSPMLKYYPVSMVVFVILGSILSVVWPWVRHWFGG